jgi:hypothetical protein
MERQRDWLAFEYFVLEMLELKDVFHRVVDFEMLQSTNFFMVGPLDVDVGGLLNPFGR